MTKISNTANFNLNFSYKKRNLSNFFCSCFSKDYKKKSTVNDNKLYIKNDENHNLFIKQNKENISINDKHDSVMFFTFGHEDFQGEDKNLQLKNDLSFSEEENENKSLEKTPEEKRKEFFKANEFLLGKMNEIIHDEFIINNNNKSEQVSVLSESTWQKSCYSYNKDIKSSLIDQRSDEKQKYYSFEDFFTKNDHLSDDNRSQKEGYCYKMVEVLNKIELGFNYILEKINIIKNKIYNSVSEYITRFRTDPEIR